MSYFNNKISENDLLELYKNISNRQGHFEVASVLAFPEGNTIESTFQDKFSLSSEPKGDSQGGWNRIIILEKENRTLSEYPESERIDIWNQGLAEIKRKLEENFLN